MDGSAEFDEFVAARSTRLLRTSYLLTRDHALVARVFESREGGTLELRVTKGLSERTRLSFVEYQPVG